jgi:hypothetical protein
VSVWGCEWGMGRGEGLIVSEDLMCRGVLVCLLFLC